MMCSGKFLLLSFLVCSLAACGPSRLLKGKYQYQSAVLQEISSLEFAQNGAVIFDARNAVDRNNNLQDDCNGLIKCGIGRYTISGNDVIIQFLDPGHVVTSDSIAYTAGKDKDATVKLVLVDRHLHTPISGVKIFRGNALIGKTNDQGKIEFQSENTNLHLEISAEGYKGRSITINTSLGNQIRILLTRGDCVYPDYFRAGDTIVGKIKKEKFSYKILMENGRIYTAEE